jgi:hypothetical protein
MSGTIPGVPRIHRKQEPLVDSEFAITEACAGRSGGG